jgi:hypothetical protein
MFVMATKDELHREEARGIFVLGVIASLLAAKDSLGLALDLAHFTFSSFLVILILYWGAYTALMAVGISSDLFDEAFAARCETLARFMFVGGVWVLISAVLFVPLVYLFRTFFVDYAIAYSASASGLVTSYLFARTGGFKRLRRRPRSSA